MTDKSQDSMPGWPGPITAPPSMDLGWCEVCEERPATQSAKYVTARICAVCAEGEPEPDDAEGAR